MSNEREAEMEEIKEAYRDARFDDELKEEIYLNQFGTRDSTIEGTVQSVEKDEDSNDTALIEVSLPLEGVEGFTESMEDSTGEISLQETKLGRLIEDHNYSRDTPHHLISDTVDCVYKDGEWKIVDPNPPSTISNGRYPMPQISETDTSGQKESEDEKYPYGEPTTENIRLGFYMAGFLGALGGGMYLAQRFIEPNNPQMVDSLQMASYLTYGLLGGALICVLIMVYFIYQRRSLSEEERKRLG